MFADTSEQILQLGNELRQAREERDRYRELLLTIQRSILPQGLPSVPGLDLAVHFADADIVGGDLYEVRPVGPGRFAVVMCDVSGHGLAAAAILALVHALGSAIRGHQLLPGAALDLINKPLATRYLVNTGRFVTAFVGLYDAQARVLTYASAGHPPPRLIRGNEVQLLDHVAGYPLGVDETSIYENETLRLLPGDRLVLFTDGITESTNAAQEFFGDERLDVTIRAPARTAAELLQQIVDSVRTFRSGRPAADDETCLVALVTSSNT